MRWEHDENCHWLAEQHGFQRRCSAGQYYKVSRCHRLLRIVHKAKLLAKKYTAPRERPLNTGPAFRTATGNQELNFGIERSDLTAAAKKVGARRSISLTLLPGRSATTCSDCDRPSI